MVPPHLLAVRVDAVHPYQTSLQYGGISVAPAQAGSPVEIGFTVTHSRGVFLGLFAGTGTFSGVVTDANGSVVATTNAVNVKLQYGQYIGVRLYTPALPAQYAGQSMTAYAGPSALIGQLSPGQQYEGATNVLSRTFTVSAYVPAGSGSSSSGGASGSSGGSAGGAAGSGGSTATTTGTPTKKILGIPAGYVIGAGVLAAGGVGAWIVLHRPAPSSQTIRARADAKATLMDAKQRKKDAEAKRRGGPSRRDDYYPDPQVLTADGAPISSGRAVGQHAKRREAAGVMA